MKHTTIAGKTFFCALFLFLILFNGGAQENNSDVYYFSPNGDAVKDMLVIPLAIKDSRFIKEWRFLVTDAAGKTVYSTGEEIKKIDENIRNYKEIFFSIFKPKQSVNVPSAIEWDGGTEDGSAAPDGSYYFYILSRDDNDNYAETMRYRVVLDTTPPDINVQQPSAQDKFFGTGAKKTITIRQSGSREDKWTGSITDSAGNSVRTFEWPDSAPKDVIWNGKDDKGITVSEGDYDYAIAAVDLAGNKSPPAGVKGIRFETIVPQAEAGRSAPYLAPKGRTKSETFNFATNLDGGNREIEGWSFGIISASETGAQAVKVWQDRGSTLPPAIEWNGSLDNGAIAEGVFKGVMEIKLASGATVTAETPSFISTGLPPALNVATSPALFSPDGDKTDDELDINLSALSQLPFESWSFVIYDPNSVPFRAYSGGAEVPQRLIWDGRGDDGELVESATAYPYAFTVTDVQGQSSEVRGSIQVDVLIIRDGNKLRMRVPAIIFRANNADFVNETVDKKRGLKQETIDNNERVLGRVAEILQKFQDYNVRIEGHANSETGTAKEEQELVPLAKQRADFVKTWLVAHGIGAARLSAVGVGGREPVMKNRGDRANWWKNRRVEFILEK